MGRPRINRTHCRDCNIKLDETNTIYTRTSIDALCRKCRGIHNLKNYHEKKTPESIRATGLKRYKMTIEEYDRLFILQWGGCAICRKPCETGLRLAVDHDHKTSEIRGLLCSRCNTIVGILENSEDLVIDAVEYLKRTTWKDEVA